MVASGAAAALGAPGPIGGGLSPAYACDFYGSHFTGWSQYGFGGNSPAGAIHDYITTVQPSTVCSATPHGSEVSFWVLVGGPRTNNLQCPFPSVPIYSGLAQDGWLVNGNQVAYPHHFYEYADSDGCDYGPVYTSNATYGTSHWYQTKVGGEHEGDYASFFMDGNWIGAVQLDWYGGTSFEISAEPHAYEDHLGSNDFTGGETCTLSLNDPTGCTVDTPINTACQEIQYGYGCIEYPDPCGHYYPWYGAGDAFHVHDRRDEPGGTCLY